MKFEREVACLVEAFEPKCFQDTFTHELDVCARRRTRATRPLPRRDGQERGDASDPTPDKCIVLQQNIVFTNLFTTIFGAELVWRWTKAVANSQDLHTAFLTGACGSWARRLRVRAAHVVHPEQHLGPFPGLQRVLHRLGELRGEFVLGKVHADLIRVDQLGQRLQHLGHLRAR